MNHLLRKNLLKPSLLVSSNTRKLTLYNSKALALCIVSFVGFLRYDEKQINVKTTFI